MKDVKYPGDVVLEDIKFHLTELYKLADEHDIPYFAMFDVGSGPLLSYSLKADEYRSPMFYYILPILGELEAPTSQEEADLAAEN